MSQWKNIAWKRKDHTYPEAIEIRPHKDGKGIICSHPHVHNFHELDWDPEHETNGGDDKHHLHDGVVDHIKLHPVPRPGGLSVHARYHDKEGNLVRQDAHFEFQKDEGE